MEDLKALDQINDTTLNKIQTLTHQILMAIHCLPNLEENPAWHEKHKGSLQDFYTLAMKKKVAEAAISPCVPLEEMWCYFFSHREGMDWAGKFYPVYRLHIELIPRPLLLPIKEESIFSHNEIETRATQSKWAKLYQITPLQDQPFEKCIAKADQDKDDQKLSDVQK